MSDSTLVSVNDHRILAATVTTFYNDIGGVLIPYFAIFYPNNTHDTIDHLVVSFTRWVVNLENSLQAAQYHDFYKEDSKMDRSIDTKTGSEHIIRYEGIEMQNFYKIRLDDNLSEPILKFDNHNKTQSMYKSVVGHYNAVLANGFDNSPALHRRLISRMMEKHRSDKLCNDLISQWVTATQQFCEATTKTQLEAANHDLIREGVPHFATNIARDSTEVINTLLELKKVVMEYSTPNHPTTKSKHTKMSH